MGHLLKIKCVDSRVNVHILSSTSVPFTLTTVQVPNLALKQTKRITVYIFLLIHFLLSAQRVEPYASKDILKKAYKCTGRSYLLHREKKDLER
jgi:hypothetical protein